MIGGSQAGRSLSEFTVELEVYSGPYEWLLALVLKEELEIFEIPLRELVGLYLDSRPRDSTDVLDRDTDFAGSAAALVLLKSRNLAPATEPEPDLAEEEPLSPEELAARLERYLKVRRGAEHLRSRLAENSSHYPSGHSLTPRSGSLRVGPERIARAARRAFSRLTEPPVEHIGAITVTLQELSDLIRARLSRGPVSYESLTEEMDRMHKAVAFTAALSLAHEGRVRLSQPEPLGPLTLEPAHEQRS